MSNKDLFIKNKIKEIHIALLEDQAKVSELIGDIGDLFYSAYKREKVADEEIIQSLWSFLFEIFVVSKDDSIKFDAISTMCDMYIYQSNIGMDLSLDNLRGLMRDERAEKLSPEIIDCIDEILSA